MRWFTGYKVCMVLSWGVYLWICQFWTFSIIFFMEFEVGHMKEPFFLSRIPFFWWKNVAVIGCEKWPFCMAFLLKMAVFSPMLPINRGLFFNQRNWYSTQKKRLFQMAYFKFHEKYYWESSKLANSEINPSRENHTHFISCKPPHKNHPKEYFGTTLWFIQITTSVAFHLSATVTQ